MCQVASAQSDGPLQIRDMRPYNLLFLQFPPDTPDVLAPAKTRASAQIDMANTLLFPEEQSHVSVYEDCEYQRLNLSYRWGLNGGTEIGAFLPILARDGGFLDPILSWWHRAFGLSVNGEDNPVGRLSLPQNQSILYLSDGGGAPLVDAGSAFGPGELILTLKRALVRPTPRAALAWRAGLKLPTGNPGLLLGSGAVDTGLSLDARHSLGKGVTLYANAGAALLGKPTRVRGARTLMGQYLLTIEWRANSRDSFIWQVDGNSAPIQTGNSFADGIQSTATFGYRRQLRRNLAVTASFSENGDIHTYTLPVLSNIGPDFTASLAIEWVN